jgi:hypothetical protein
MIQIEREMQKDGNIFGYVSLNIDEEIIHVTVEMFELKTFVITCDFKNTDTKTCIQHILHKLWKIYGRYEASFTDTIQYGLPKYLPSCELTCFGYISDSCLFNFDDHIILKANYIQDHDECCLRREFYENENDYENHAYNTSIDIYICSNMLVVVHDESRINNIKIPKSYDMSQVLECIFCALQRSDGYIVKTVINQFYTYNKKNLEYIISRNPKLPCFSPFKHECVGYVVKSEKEYIMYYKESSNELIYI